MTLHSSSNSTTDIPHSSKYLIKHVGLAEFSLKVGWAGKHKSSDVRPVVGDKHLHGSLGDFAHVVVSLLHAESCKPQRRLTTTTCSTITQSPANEKHPSHPISWVFLSHPLSATSKQQADSTDQHPMDNMYEWMYITKLVDRAQWSSVTELCTKGLA